MKHLHAIAYRKLVFDCTTHRHDRARCVPAEDSWELLDHHAKLLNLPVRGIERRRFDAHEDLICAGFRDGSCPDRELTALGLQEKGFLLLRRHEV